MYNERLGKLHFWLMTPAFWMESLGQIEVGLKGMRRRIVDYEAGLGIGLAVLIMIVNLVYSAQRGPVAERNPLRSRSPEWQILPPVPEVGYAQPLKVVGDPYDYGLPDSAYVRMPAPAAAAGE